VSPVGEIVERLDNQAIRRGIVFETGGCEARVGFITGQIQGAGTAQ
jgi:hypothetical protein